MTKPLPRGYHKYPDANRLRVRFNTAPDAAKRQIIGVQNDDSGLFEQIERDAPESFQAVWLPPSDQIRDMIVPAEANQLEKRLLRIAFGRHFKPESLASRSSIHYLRELERAEDRLNHLIKTVLPPEHGLRWTIRGHSEQKGLGFMLRDRHGGVTALGSRGSGICRVTSVMAHLMDHEFDNFHTLLLFDEPETSLHADAQHLLRGLLENLGSKPNIQVVYATHSPSMVNPLRPHAVRLLSRTTSGERATSVIDNCPFKGNFYPVRASLGLTPADSLLYAPVTIVVEGDTEVIALPLLLLKLADAGVPGFDRVRILFPQVHFLDGVGDQFAQMCKLAHSQRSKPVIFLDGDKRRHLSKFPIPDGVPVVLLQGETEFEEIVPVADYLRAVAAVVERSEDELSVGQYSTWEKQAGLPPRMAFSKRVERWLESMDLKVSKAQVMRRAVEMVDATQVTTTPLAELIAHVERLLVQLS